MLARFRQRNLFVRCLEISRRTVDTASWKGYGRQKLIDLTEQPKELSDVEASIHKYLGDVTAESATYTIFGSAYPTFRD